MSKPENPLNPAGHCRNFESCSNRPGAEMAARLGKLFCDHNGSLVRFFGARLRNSSHHAEDIAQVRFFRLSR